MPKKIDGVVRPEEVTIQTDQTEYVAQFDSTVNKQDRYKFPLTARFENRTGVPIYLERCYPNTSYPIYDIGPDNGKGVESSSGSFDSLYTAVRGCVGHDNPIIVQPGELRVDNLTIYAPNAWREGFLIPKDKLNGQYRLIYRAHFCWELRYCERPDAVQYSNIFTVRVQ
ncbi:MAG TPA: hypothetical protein VF452_02255 [Candidatus Binatia bacterium]